MNWDDDEDSVFEQALRADLPTASQQDRMRKRILAAGVAAGTALGSAHVTAAAQTGLGVSALSKLSALSWPAKLGLTAALAAPVLALPLLQSSKSSGANVSQVRAGVAPAVAQTGRTVGVMPPHGPPLASSPAALPATGSEPPLANPAARASRVSTGNRVWAAAPSASPSPVGMNDVSAAQPAVAAFDSVAPEAAAGERAPPATASSTLATSSTLAAETQLLDRAFSALAAGDRTTAAMLVAEHARRFPNGLLRQERERARVRLAQDPKGE